MKDRNIKPPPLREVSRSDGGCDFEVLSKIILAERLHPSPLRGTPLKGRGSEVRSESDSSEVRSGLRRSLGTSPLTRTFNYGLNIQPPLTLRACPLLKKEGRKNSPLLRGVDLRIKDSQIRGVS